MAGNKTFTSDIDDVDDMLEMKCTIVNSGNKGNRNIVDTKTLVLSFLFQIVCLGTCD